MATNKRGYSWAECSKLTERINTLRTQIKAGEFVYTGSRIHPTTGDEIFCALKPSVKFMVEFTFKLNSRGEKYCNWFAMYGPTKEQEQFLKEAGHAAYQDYESKELDW